MKSTPRIEFNWGFHDGIAAAYRKKSFHSIDNNKVASKYYVAGWKAGFYFFKDIGTAGDDRDSQNAWNQYQTKKNPRSLRMSRGSTRYNNFRMSKVPGRDPRKVKRTLRRLHGGRGLRINPHAGVGKINIPLHSPRQYSLKNNPAWPDSKRPSLLAEGNAEARIRRKSATDEWIVTLRVQGVLQKDATYYTNDFDDAIGTAKAMVKQANTMKKNPGRFVGKFGEKKQRRKGVSVKLADRKLHRPIYEQYLQEQKQYQGKENHVCVEVQRGADSWHRIAQMKDTPEFRTLAQRFAKTYKRKHRGAVVRVVAY